MNNAEEHKGKRQDVDKLLKGLPKVQASADFEERLQRRITEEAKDRPAGGWLKNVFGPRRIPALAYSLTTLVLVGIVSYYALFRSGNAPKPEQPAFQQHDSSAVADASNVAPSTVGRKADDKTPESDSREPHLTTPTATLRTQTAKPLPQQKQRREDLRDESLSQEPAPEKDALESGDVAQDQKKEQPVRQLQAPVPPVAKGAEVQSQDVRSNAAAVPEPEAKVESSVAQPQMIQNQLHAPTAQPLKFVSEPETSIARQLKLVGEQLDSLGPKDSIKMDSLRQLQRYLLMQQRKAKIRKPSSEE